MTAWSRRLFGASIVFGVGAVLLAEQLPEWWGPASLLCMVLAAAGFLTCSVLEYRRGRSAAGSLG
ncbi:hypothetical protein [Arthrobacter sunyaminii]|uniref:Uncharacterized protein n=1 Tax=Arthrobacter sunyaminii TaxID=2816859 RepID=A0A975PCC2_9MICC|nr:hypothetical protein [Arthrobacter sunyaminii]MBO0895813.1 hypothetical protein [Arthrobacter sunyaminii]MBO0907467.1 hypothetical protein [Arthrobacter sunyaminii]QWQ35045.1 hypothetical protein KG104_10965 [Arthrobacter sunyaminii]